MLGLVPFKFNNGENSKGLSINDMFNDFFNDDMLADFKSCGNFKTDIKETPEEYVVHAELPGVNKEDINIDYNNNYLTISATRNNEHEEKKDNYIRRERSYGSVSRGFYINNVNKETIKAKFHNDVFKTLKRYQKILFHYFNYCNMLKWMIHPSSISNCRQSMIKNRVNI